MGPDPVLIAPSLGVLAFLEYDKLRRSNDADFLFQTENDYGAFFDHLVAVGDWVIQPDVFSQLALIDITNVQKDGGVAILSEVEVPEEIWRHGRAVKTHFKSIAKFHNQGIVSGTAVYSALDHWGYRLLMKSIRKMDVHRFYHARRDAPNRVTQTEFDDDFGWYRVLETIKPV